MSIEYKNVSLTTPKCWSIWDISRGEAVAMAKSQSQCKLSANEKPRLLYQNPLDQWAIVPKSRGGGTKSRVLRRSSNYFLMLSWRSFYAYFLVSPPGIPIRGFIFSLSVGGLTGQKKKIMAIFLVSSQIPIKGWTNKKLTKQILFSS